jgi:hypothetical protein
MERTMGGGGAAGAAAAAGLAGTDVLQGAEEQEWVLSIYIESFLWRYKWPAASAVLLETHQLHPGKYNMNNIYDPSLPIRLAHCAAAAAAAAAAAWSAVLGKRSDATASRPTSTPHGLRGECFCKEF